MDFELLARTVSDVLEELTPIDISFELLFSAFSGGLGSISELSLTLMELIIDRERLRKTKVTHLVRRRKVISDVLINRIIARMLEGVSPACHPRVDRDLVTLINYQLTGPAAKLAKQREKKLSIHLIREAAHELGCAGVNPSLRAIGKQLGVNASTVKRSIPSADMQRIQRANRPESLRSGDRSVYAFQFVLGCIPEGNGADTNAFLLACEIVEAYSELAEAELRPMVEDALRGRLACFSDRVAPED